MKYQYSSADHFLGITLGLCLHLPLLVGETLQHNTHDLRPRAHQTDNLTAHFFPSSAVWQCQLALMSVLGRILKQVGYYSQQIHQKSCQNAVIPPSDSVQAC